MTGNDLIDTPQFPSVKQNRRQFLLFVEPSTFPVLNVALVGFVEEMCYVVKSNIFERTLALARFDYLTQVRNELEATILAKHHSLKLSLGNYQQHAWTYRISDWETGERTRICDNCGCEDQGSPLEFDWLEYPPCE